MKPVLDREQMARFDRLASECGVPSATLMENAGRGATEHLLERFGTGASYLVLCGPGNNGGDGYVVARRLLALGARVEVVTLTPGANLKGPAAQNARAFVELGGVVRELVDDAGVPALDVMLERADVVVDALFGTGLARELTDRYAAAIERVNRAAVRRAALDTPSGIDVDTGGVLGAALRAEVTISFGHLKQGLLTPSALEYTGELRVIDIGVPSDLVQRVGANAELVERADLAAQLPPRSPAVHKGAAGRVAVVAGSPGTLGAALLSARGALRAGAGSVTFVNTSDVTELLDRRVLEEMTERIESNGIEFDLVRALERLDAVVIGPGLGTDARGRRLVDAALRCSGFKVLDADGLTAFAGRAAELRSVPGALVLTPHPGEAARLLGVSSAQVEADRYGAAARLAELTGAAVLLKGAYTLVAAQGRTTRVNGFSTPALATAGSGDVLAGIIAAFGCQLDAFSAAWLGAGCHGLAGQAWSSEQGGADRGLLAHEIADRLPRCVAALRHEAST